MSPVGHKRTSRTIAIYVRYWGLSGHKTDPPPKSRCAITSPRSSESIFFGNLRRAKQGRASCFYFSRGKVLRLVAVTEAAPRRRTLGRRFARAGVWESGMGRKKTHFDFFPFLASKPAFFSHAARRSSTVTVVPSLCLFQSFESVIFGMTHTSTMCRSHTRTHSFQTLYVWRSCLAGSGISDGEKRSISDSPTFSRRAGDPSRLECASPTHIKRASRIGGRTSAPAVP